MGKISKLRKILAAEGLMKQASNSSLDSFREIIDGRMMPELASAVAKAVGSTKPASFGTERYRDGDEAVSISGAMKIWGDGYASCEDSEHGYFSDEAIQKRMEDAARALTSKFGVKFEEDPNGWSDYDYSVGFLVDLDELRLAYLTRNLK